MTHITTELASWKPHFKQLRCYSVVIPKHEVSPARTFVLSKTIMQALTTYTWRPALGPDVLNHDAFYRFHVRPLRSAIHSRNKSKPIAIGMIVLVIVTMITHTSYSRVFAKRLSQFAQMRLANDLICALPDLGRTPSAQRIVNISYRMICHKYLIYLGR